MIVRDLHFICIAILPAKTYAILFVDANTVLADTISTQPLKLIARWYREIRKIASTVKLVKLAASRWP